MIRPTGMALFALAFMACAGSLRDVRRSEDLLAAGDLKGALSRASDASTEVRRSVAQAVMKSIDPVLTVSVVPHSELAPLSGLHSLRAADPAWLILRARVTPGPTEAALAFGAVEVAAAITQDGKELLTLEHDAKALSPLTGEMYPRDIDHSTLKTGDFPLAAHVLTVGILSVLTLHVEHNYSPPPVEKVQAAVPLAIRLAAALEKADGSSRSNELLVVRRPQSDVAPLELRVVATVRPPGEMPLSLAVKIDLPPGGRLEERLARAATGLHLMADPGARAAYGTQPVLSERCTTPFDLMVKSARCATLLPMPWPGNDITPIDLVLPAPPRCSNRKPTAIAAALGPT